MGVSSGCARGGADDGAGSKLCYSMSNLGKLYLVPCPRCGSTEVRPRGRIALEGQWPDVALKRRYKCGNCGFSYHTLELSEEEPTLLSSSPLPCERE